MYVAVVLGIVTLILLAVIIVISHQASRGKADSSESCSEIGTNCTGNCTSSRKYRYGESCSTTLKMLIENLCVKEQGCELCPPGWQLHMGRCYHFSEDIAAWDASQRHCSASRSQLLILEGEAEMEFLDQKKEQNRFFWIGLTFREKEGRWIWLSDPQTKGYRVAIHENEAGKHCALYKRKQGIEFESCQNSHRWICKKNAVLLAP
ncbi:CD209 antigen-like protein E isoform X2 [Alligator sinensis]|nr:CD209 antigen-like protein E isoform X2 [Alligator sinensis]